MTAKTVLVVHDDADLVASVRAALSASAPDIELINALSGPRALGMMAQAVPSVLVVDAELAGVDGYAFTRQVKTAPETAQVPVIVVSLDPNEVSALKARQVGAAAHLPSTGPVDPLVAKIVALASAAQPAAAGSDSPEAVPAAPQGAVPGVPVEGVAAPASVSAPAGAAVAPTPDAPQPVSSLQPDDAGYGAPQPVSAEMSYATSAGSSPQSSANPEVTAEPKPSGPPGSGAPHIDDMLRMMLERGGSDLHIAVGSAPGIRQRGELIPVENMRPLSPRDTMEMILGLLSEEQRRRFETELELDFAYSIPGVSRFRANVFQQRNSMGAVFRVIPIQIPTLEDLACPRSAPTSPTGPAASCL